MILAEKDTRGIDYFGFFGRYKNHTAEQKKKKYPSSAILDTESAAPDIRRHSKDQQLTASLFPSPDLHTCSCSVTIWTKRDLVSLSEASGSSEHHSGLAPLVLVLSLFTPTTKSEAP
jgi:hypothetical protein